MPKKNWDKVETSVKSIEPDKLQRSVEQKRQQFGPLESQIQDLADLGFIEGDGIGLYTLHEVLRSWMTYIETGVNKAKAVTVVTDDGILEVTKADGSVLKAHRKITREV